MNVIKRNGQEVVFDVTKIQNAIRKANAEVLDSQQLSEDDIIYISQQIEKICSKRTFACSYVMKPNRYHALKRNQYLAGNRALLTMETQVTLLKFHTALLPNSCSQ